VAPPAGVTDANGGNNAVTDSDAVGTARASGTPQSIPALSTWCLILLVIAVGFVALRSRRLARYSSAALR
jgi:hypothetical protein